MLADIFEQDVTIPESFEGTALGAAVLGMYSLGLVDDLSDVKKFVGVTNVHHPDESTFHAYRSLVPIYIRLSRLLQTEYKNIADYQRAEEQKRQDQDN